MKYFAKKTIYIGIAAMLSLAMGTAVHAQTTEAPVTLAFAFPSFSLKSLFESHIQNDKVNAVNNRDTRNALLESKVNALAATIASTTDASVADADASSSLAVANSLSLSLINLQNIQSRIYVRAADAENEGYNIETVAAPLAEAGGELNMASSSIDVMYQTYDLTDASGTAAFSTAVASTTAELEAAKGFMGDTLAALKALVGN